MLSSLKLWNTNLKFLDQIFSHLDQHMHSCRAMMNHVIFAVLGIHKPGYLEYCRGVRKPWWGGVSICCIVMTCVDRQHSLLVRWWPGTVCSLSSKASINRTHQLSINIVLLEFLKLCPGLSACFISYVLRDLICLMQLSLSLSLSLSKILGNWSFSHSPLISLWMTLKWEIFFLSTSYVSYLSCAH